MSKRLTFIVCSIAAVGIFILISTLAGNREISDADKENAFKSLLHDWQIEVQSSYQVIHYKEISTHSEWGTTQIFSQLVLPKEQAGSLIKQLHDPQFIGKDVDVGPNNFELFPIVLSSHSKQKILWSIKPEMPATPEVDWWKSEGKPECLYGFIVTDDTRQFIRFSVVEGNTNVWIFVEALSRKGEKK